MNIHPTAVIDSRAKVPASCQVGPYCVIGPHVELGEDCRLISHVAIEGPTKIGAHNIFFPFCAIGMAPQDVTYKGEPTRLEIGEHNEIREYVTLNRGTVKGGGLTKVGSHTLIMAYAHVGHDSVNYFSFRLFLRCQDNNCGNGRQRTRVEKPIAAHAHE